MRCKVLLDTNVLVAASTFYVSKDWKMPRKHPFFEQSNELVNFLRGNIEKRIGIITRTIEEQTPYALEAAIQTTILRKESIDREVEFPLFSAIQNSCERRLNDILRSLMTEVVDEDVVNKNYVHVDKMYRELAEDYIEQFLESRAEKLALATPRRFRSLARSIYKERQKKEDFQLWNLIKKPVEPSDKRILAETIYLSMFYERNEPEQITFYLSSTDHHFSPKRWVGAIESRQVTDRIKEKFDIICDWPQQIEELAKRKLKEKPFEIPKIP